MKYIRFTLLAIVAVFIAFFFVVNRDIRENEKKSPVPQQLTNRSNFETITDEQGQVTIKVTPMMFNDEQWKFEVVLNTHSVDLSQDMLQITELVDSQGNLYKPIAWEGDEPGGHHREGALIFSPFSPVPDGIELKIKNVSGIPERSFKWDLQ